MWMNQNFLLSEDVVVQVPLMVRFMSLRESGRLVFKVEQSGQVSGHIFSMLSFTLFVTFVLYTIDVYFSTFYFILIFNALTYATINFCILLCKF